MNARDFKKINLPDTPGVYFFEGGKGEILYIGKATSLRDRVRSYFTNDIKKTRGMKVFTMVVLAKKITYQKTDSVLEALIAENNLIKKYKPPYNTKEKDDKSYNVVLITKEDFPRILLERNKNLSRWRKKNIKHVFGPFPNGTALRSALSLVRKIFPYRDSCVPPRKGETSKMCFRAQIGLCPGVCSGAITAEEYGAIIRLIKLFFDGNKNEVLSNLKSEMKARAKGQEFEKANQIKKTIFALSHIEDIALIKDSVEDKNQKIRIEAFDIAHLSGGHRVGVMVAVVNNKPKRELYRTFKIKEDKNDDTGGLRELLFRRFKHAEWGIPSIVVLDGGVAQLNVAKDVLKTGLEPLKIVSVVKNEHHRPRTILGEKEVVDNWKGSILLANAEAHRFAIGYHKRVRNKSFLPKRS